MFIMSEYIINPYVSEALSCALLSVANHLLSHLRNGCRSLAHSSCRPPHRRSPTPPIVTSCSAPRGHAPSAVLLLHNCAHRARHLRATTTSSRCIRYQASLPPPQKAQPRKSSDCRGHEAQPRGGGGGGGGTYSIIILVLT